MKNKSGFYDAIIIPTGETTFGDYSFPVTKKALELFESGKYGCIFITGGYSGFATKERLEERTKDGYRNSEGRETYDYILNNTNINPDKVHYDDQSLESVGNFSFPIVKPMRTEGRKNPSFNEFDNMIVIGQWGHIWRLEDYAKLVMPERFRNQNNYLPEDEVHFHSVPGEHNNGIMARTYHKGLMNAIHSYLEKEKYVGVNEAYKVHDFLMENHPFHSKGWYDKPVLERKALMAGVGGLWRLGFNARLK